MYHVICDMTRHTHERSTRYVTSRTVSCHVRHDSSHTRTIHVTHTNESCHAYLTYVSLYGCTFCVSTFRCVYLRFYVYMDIRFAWYSSWRDISYTTFVCVTSHVTHDMIHFVVCIYVSRFTWIYVLHDTVRDVTYRILRSCVWRVMSHMSWYISLCVSTFLVLHGYTFCASTFRCVYLRFYVYQAL